MYTSGFLRVQSFLSVRKEYIDSPTVDARPVLLFHAHNIGYATILAAGWADRTGVSHVGGSYASCLGHTVSRMRRS